MFDLIKKIIQTNSDKVEPTDQDVMTAHLALTVLLLEAAHADGKCSKEEKRHLVTTLETHFNVSKKEIESLLDESNTHREDYVDLFRYTRFLNENFTEKQKIKTIESVWRIILIDDHLEAHEDHFVHKLANLLGLSHKDLIDAKLRAREQLS